MLVYLVVALPWAKEASAKRDDRLAAGEEANGP